MKKHILIKCANKYFVIIIIFIIIITTIGVIQTILFFAWVN